MLGGKLLVDKFSILLFCSPRFTERLAHNIDMLGGARYMFLTHKYDDVT